MMPSMKRLSTRAVSLMGSPRPSCMSRSERNSARPPSCCMPTSNDTRVRVEDLVNIMPSVLPLSSSWGMPLRCLNLRLSASERVWYISSVVQSCSVSRCFCAKAFWGKYDSSFILYSLLF